MERTILGNKSRSLHAHIINPSQASAAAIAETIMHSELRSSDQKEDKRVVGKLEGKVALVTGGGINMGKAIALKLASEGAKVVISGMAFEEESLKKTVGEFQSLGLKADYVLADISKDEDAEKQIQQTLKTYGKIDILVNNAGIAGGFSKIEEIPISTDGKTDWNTTLATNFIGSWFSIVKTVRAMRKLKIGGAIVNISTYYADQPYIFRGIYTVPKILQKALTKILAPSLRKYGISIMDVRPSLIRGPRMDLVIKGNIEKLEKEGVLDKAMLTRMEGEVSRAVGAGNERVKKQVEELEARPKEVPAQYVKPIVWFWENLTPDIKEIKARTDLSPEIKETLLNFKREIPLNPPSFEDVADKVLSLVLSAPNQSGIEHFVSTLEPDLPHLESDNVVRVEREAAPKAFSDGKLLIAAFDKSQTTKKRVDEIAKSYAMAGVREIVIGVSPEMESDYRSTNFLAHNRTPTIWVKPVNFSDEQSVQTFFASLGVLEGSVLITGEPGESAQFLDLPAHINLGELDDAAFKTIETNYTKQLNHFLDQFVTGSLLFARESSKALADGRGFYYVGPETNDPESILLRDALAQIVREKEVERTILGNKSRSLHAHIINPSQASPAAIAETIMHSELRSAYPFRKARTVSTKTKSSANAMKIIRKLLEGHKPTLREVVNWIENGDERATVVLREIDEVLKNKKSRSKIVGITGAVGVGKSTLVEDLIAAYRKDGKAVAVIAIDPTSPVTGGAILADRMRLSHNMVTDKDVFYRSVATRGGKGGLAPSTADILKVFKIFGIKATNAYDFVLVETEGVGQSQMSVRHVVDTMVAVLTPGGGDILTLSKESYAKHADIVVVNKADFKESTTTLDDAVRIFYRRDSTGWQIPVIRTVAVKSKDEGILLLKREIAAHIEHANQIQEKQRKVAAYVSPFKKEVLPKGKVLVIDLNEQNRAVEFSHQLSWNGYEVVYLNLKEHLLKMLQNKEPFSMNKLIENEGVNAVYIEIGTFQEADLFVKAAIGDIESWDKVSIIARSRSGNLDNVIFGVGRDFEQGILQSESGGHHATLVQSIVSDEDVLNLLDGWIKRPELPSEHDWDTLVQNAVANGRSTVPVLKLMRFIENGVGGYQKMDELVFQLPREAYRIGFSGPPGAGKSSLIASTIKEFRRLGLKVGVISTDPSRTRGDGALLIDHHRMQEFLNDDDVMIRSLALRDGEGGIAPTAEAIARLMDAMGMDIILLESEGIGQTQNEILKHVDTSILVLSPNYIGDIQAMKAGFMEGHHIYALNKSEREAAHAFTAGVELESGLSTQPLREHNWRPVMVKTSAIDQTGIAELVVRIHEHAELALQMKPRQELRGGKFEEVVQHLNEAQKPLSYWTRVLRETHDKEYAIEKIKSQVKEHLDHVMQFIDKDDFKTRVVKVVHTAIIVQDAASFGLPTYEVESEKTRVAMLDLEDGTTIEFIEPHHSRTDLKNYLAKKGESIHHVAMAVQNLDETVKQAEQLGLGEKTRQATNEYEGYAAAFIFNRQEKLLLEFVEYQDGKERKYAQVLDRGDLPDVEAAGQYPFTGGNFPTTKGPGGYGDRQYLGRSTREETNRGYRQIQSTGSLRFSVAAQNATQIGLESSHPLARYNIGSEGAPFDTLDDLDKLFSGIDFTNPSVTVSYTQNAAAVPVVAMHIELVRKRLLAKGLTEHQAEEFIRTKLSGTVQHDNNKERATRNNFGISALGSERMLNDFFEWRARNLTRWNSISVSDYHYREAGARDVQGVAFALANAILYAQSFFKNKPRTQVKMSELLEQFTFFYDAYLFEETGEDFVREVAKFRAARRLWAKIAKHVLGAPDDGGKNKAWMHRFHTQTSGVPLSDKTEPQQMLNVIRVLTEGLAAIYGGTNTLHLDAYDEATNPPTEHSLEIVMDSHRILQEIVGENPNPDLLFEGGDELLKSHITQLQAKGFNLIRQKMKPATGEWTPELEIHIKQLIEHEVIKKLGSLDHVREKLNQYTNEIEREAYDIIQTILKLHEEEGPDAMAAFQSDLIQKQNIRKQILREKRLQAAPMNAKNTNVLSQTPLAEKALPSLGEAIAKMKDYVQRRDAEINKLEMHKGNRNNADVQNTLENLKKAAESGENTVPFFRLSARAGATIGEMMEVMVGVYGPYKKTMFPAKTLKMPDVKQIRSTRPVRMYLAKLGLDGHERGLNLVAAAAKNAGVEVIYGGLRHTPHMVAKAALDEGADIIGIGSLSGDTLTFAHELMQELEKRDGKVKVVFGGVTLDNGPYLKVLGVDHTFDPSKGTGELEQLIDYVQIYADEYAPVHSEVRNDLLNRDELRSSLLLFEFLKIRLLPFHYLNERGKEFAASVLNWMNGEQLYGASAEILTMNQPPDSFNMLSNPSQAANLKIQMAVFFNGMPNFSGQAGQLDQRVQVLIDFLSHTKHAHVQMIVPGASRIELNQLEQMMIREISRRRQNTGLKTTGVDLVVTDHLSSDVRLTSGLSRSFVFDANKDRLKVISARLDERSQTLLMLGESAEGLLAGINTVVMQPHIPQGIQTESDIFSLMENLELAARLRRSTQIAA